MRRLVAFAVLLAGCTSMPSPTQDTVEQPQASQQAPYLWEGRGSPEGRAAIRACLDRERATGDPASCRAAAAGDRLGNWAIIDNWENEMKVTLAWLRANGPADDVDASQQAWEASMMADVSVYMNMYEGGTMAGLVGSIARAEAVMDRVVFLEKLRRQIELA